MAPVNHSPARNKNTTTALNVILKDCKKSGKIDGRTRNEEMKKKGGKEE